MHLFRHFKNVAASDLALFCFGSLAYDRQFSNRWQRTHELEHLRQILERNRFERGLDQSTSKEVDGFNTILAVTDIATLDVDHLDDSVEDRCLEECPGRETDGNDGAARASIFNSLLEWFLGNSE